MIARGYGHGYDDAYKYEQEHVYKGCDNGYGCGCDYVHYCDYGQGHVYCYEYYGYCYDQDMVMF